MTKMSYLTACGQDAIPLAIKDASKTHVILILLLLKIIKSLFQKDDIFSKQYVSHIWSSTT